MTDPKVYIGGPYEWIDTDDRSAGVTTRGSSTPVALWNVEESRADNRASINASNVPGLDAEETILGGFLGREEFAFDGVATGNRLSGKADGLGYGRNGLPSHPYAAIKEYALRLESLVSYDQGIGYKLEDNQRGRILNPESGGTEDWDSIVIKSVTWERKAASEEELEYTVEGVRAQGTSTGGASAGGVGIRKDWIDDQKNNWVELPSISSSQAKKLQPEYRKFFNVDSPDWDNGAVPAYIPHSQEFSNVSDIDKQQTRGNELIDDTGGVPIAFSLGSIDTMRVEKSVDTNVKEIALGSPGDNIALPVESPQYNLFIEGNVSTEDMLNVGSISTYTDARQRLNTFAKYIPNNWIGTNSPVYYRDTFTDRQWKGQIKNYSTTWESGTDISLNYTVEIIVGSTIGK